MAALLLLASLDLTLVHEEIIPVATLCHSRSVKYPGLAAMQTLDKWL
jgi:hypothetical protein